MLSKFFSEDESNDNEINTSIIKIRGRTLIFVNSIYQISNIASLRLLNLSRVQPFPKYLVWLIIIGLALLFVYAEFLKQMMLVLYNIMNNDEPRAVTFNLDQRQIVEDKSINIDSMFGSSCVSGNVTGDVVSNV